MTAKRHGARKITAGSRKSTNTPGTMQRKFGIRKAILPRTTAKKLTGDGSFNYGFSKNKVTKSGAKANATRIRKPGVHKRRK